MNNLTAETLNNFVDYAGNVFVDPIMSALSFTYTCSLLTHDVKNVNIRNFFRLSHDIFMNN